jgi:tetratricopeptide (TPR) repeat protein
MTTQLTESPAASSPVRTLGPARHRKVAGLHVLRVAGSPYEMGRQHGALLKDEIPNGPLYYWRTYLEKILKNARLGRLAPPVRKVINGTVGRRVARALPPFAKETLRGLADGADVPYEDVLEGATMPDTLLWVVARLMNLRQIDPAVRHRLELSLGCTSAMAWGAATADGKLLHARNLDYHGVGTWPQNQAIIFHVPDEGMRFVSVAAAGIPLGGATAMNEAGLSLVVHQHMFSNGARLGGTTIGTVGDIVMRKAENLDDAERILREYDPIGCWTYLISDGNTGEVLCFEENPDHQVAIRTRPGDTTFGYTNIYLDPQLGATERNLYPSYWRHNQGRYENVQARLKERHGSHDPTSMAGILADTGCDQCRIRHSVAMLMTVASVVFQPEDGTVWVGAGEAPTSHRPFEPFSMKTEDHAPELGRLTEHVPGTSESLEAFDAFREAYLAFIDAGDMETACSHMERACELQPRQSLYHKLSGLLALRAGDPARARRDLDRALDLGHPDPEREASFRLWRARTMDLSGQRDEALAEYRSVLNAERADPNVRAAARRGLKRRFTEKNASRVPIEFAGIDVVKP